MCGGYDGSTGVDTVRGVSLRNRWSPADPDTGSTAPGRLPPAREEQRGDPGVGADLHQSRRRHGDLGHRSQHALQQGHHLAQELIDTPVGIATAEIESSGFEPQVLRHDTTLVTADLRPERIRLFVDPEGRVVNATAG